MSVLAYRYPQAVCRAIRGEVRPAGVYPTLCRLSSIKRVSQGSSGALRCPGAWRFSASHRTTELMLLVAAHGYAHLPHPLPPFPMAGPGA